MKTFQDIKDSGIANAQYTFKEPNLIDNRSDRLSQHWNMYWGSMTDTHMSNFEDGWIITGDYISDKHVFNRLLNTSQIEQLQLPHSWEQVMEYQGLLGDFVMHNGQLAYRIIKDPDVLI